jgi:hypothetical protein
MNTVNLLDQITQRICDGQILSITNASSLHVDEVIEKRDSPDFEQRWLVQYNTLEKRKSDIGIEDTAAIDRLREAAYKAAHKCTQNPDIAAFTSDDFELIGRAVVLNIDDPWINGLWLNYKSNKFCVGEVTAVAGNLRSLID